MTDKEFTNSRGEQLDPRLVARNRLLLVLVFAIPLVTILAATFVFKTGIGMPEGTGNKGVLIVPPLQIDDIDIMDKDGKRFVYSAQETWAWTFLVPGDGSCDAKCEHTLWFTGQVLSVLGQKSHRVRRFYLNVGGRNGDDLSRILTNDHPKLETLYTTSQQFDKLRAGADTPLTPIKDNVYFLVDPRGFVMMYYTPEHTGKEVFKDLRFLLKQSGG